MKLYVFPLFFLSAFALLQDMTEQTAFGLVRGFFDGLHFEKLAMNVTNCRVSINNTIQSFKDLGHYSKEDKSLYGLVNNVTKALGNIPKVTRYCTVAPGEVWSGMKKIYYGIFNGSLIAYSLSIAKNILFNPDTFFHKIFATRTHLMKKEFYQAGYSIGSLLNFLLNVTDKPPVPPPPEVTVETFDLEADWNDVHEKMMRYINYTVITLKYTRFVNETTLHKLHHSLVNIEERAYSAMIGFKKKEIFESILKLFDILGYLNELWNGLYFGVQELPKHIAKDLIFSQPSYIVFNLVSHSSNIIWNGITLYSAVKSGDTMEILRRGGILVRKLLYLGEDTLEEIHNQTPLLKAIADLRP